MFYVGAAEAAPRSIPWDCSDWQASPAVADADDARVSMILESLAANRGKAIYCAIDQSDTWTKAETWAAGRDRNERDDTVYFGQSGNFRGFLAAQEGYLTDGESGVTGVSRDLIFEFPREEKRRRRYRNKRISHTADWGMPPYDDKLPVGSWGAWSGYRTGSNARNNLARQAYTASRPVFDADALAQPFAADYCRSRNARLKSYGHVEQDLQRPANNTGGWKYSETELHPTDPSRGYRVRVALFYRWTAECIKRVRR